VPEVCLLCCELVPRVAGEMSLLKKVETEREGGVTEEMKEGRRS
jgi:hypothetical protein